MSDMTTMEALRLVREVPAEQLRDDQIAGLRACLSRNPGLPAALGGKQAVEEYLAAAEGAPSVIEAIVVEEDEAESEPPPEAASGSNRMLLELVCLLAFGAVALGAFYRLVIFESGEPPAAVVENADDETDDQDRTDVVADTTTTDSPEATDEATDPESDSQEEKPDKSNSDDKPETAEDRQQKWLGWQVEFDPQTIVSIDAAWDLSDPENPQPIPRLITRGGSATLSRRLTVEGDENCLQFDVELLGTAEDPGEVEVRINDAPVAQFVIPTGEAKQRYLVRLAPYAGQTVDVEVVYHSGTDDSVRWNQVVLGDVPVGLTRDLKSQPLPDDAADPALFAQYLPSPIALFEDEPDLLDVAEEDAAQFVGTDKAYSGETTLRIPVGEDAGLRMAGFSLAIREHPGRGEFRYLRFAMRKRGGGSLKITFIPAEGPAEVRTYLAGPKPTTAERTKQLWQWNVPDEWIVLTRDLFADFGAMEIRSLDISALGGEAALVDHVYLAAAEADLGEIQTAPNLRQDNSELVKIALAHPLAFGAMHAMVAIEVDGNPGAGVVVSPEGYVVSTAYAATAPNRDATIRLYDGRTVKAKTLGMDRSMNAAALKILEPGPFDHAPLSKAWPGGGMYVFSPATDWKESRPVMSSPAGLRGAQGAYAWTNIGIGNEHSGGALVTDKGELVALNSHASGFAGGGLHLPTSVILGVWQRMINGEVLGTWHGPWLPMLGITLKEVDGKSHVEHVEPGTPAAAAEVQVGDEVVSLGGKPVKSTGDIQGILALRNPGDKLRLELLREGKSLVKMVHVARRP